MSLKHSFDFDKSWFFNAMENSCLERDNAVKG